MDKVNFLNVEYIYLRIFEFFQNLDTIALLNGVIYYLYEIRWVSAVLTAFLIWVISYSRSRLERIDKASKDKVFHSHGPTAAPTAEVHDEELHNKWQKVQAHINSSNPSDWRLAILEADIILGDVLDRLGYQGDSIGDKLKTVDKSDFLTLNLAWEAHKVRNQIAHEGSDFLLNEREAKRAIDLYRQVFEEFYYL